MSKAPAFQFYAGDWLSDGRVSMLTLEAQGIYLRLLCHQWLEGSLPLYPQNISKISRIHQRKFSRNWKHLEQFFPVISLENGDEVRCNIRLMEQRKAYEERHLKLSEAGRKGGSRSPVSTKAQLNPEGEATFKPSTSSSVPLSKDRGTPDSKTKPPNWAYEIVDVWDDEKGLPALANRATCAGEIEKLHRLDGHERSEILAVVRHILEHGVPKFIASPMKLRQKTKAGDQRTFNYWANDLATGVRSSSTRRNGSTQPTATAIAAAAATVTGD